MWGSQYLLHPLDKFLEGSGFQNVVTSLRSPLSYDSQIVLPQAILQVIGHLLPGFTFLFKFYSWAGISTVLSGSVEIIFSAWETSSDVL